ncbi:MAG: hypothetical protein M3Q80_03095 [bacterium]|nr:hypothetical protein [bacterium]
MKLLQVALIGLILFVVGMFVTLWFKPVLLKNDLLMFLSILPVTIGLLLMMISFAYGLSTRDAPHHF